MPIVDSLQTKEKSEEFKIVQKLSKYISQMWMIYVDFKRVNFLLDQQSGYPNILAFCVCRTAVVRSVLCEKRVVCLEKLSKWETEFYQCTTS